MNAENKNYDMDEPEEKEMTKKKKESSRGQEYGHEYSPGGTREGKGMEKKERRNEDDTEENW